MLCVVYLREEVFMIQHGCTKRPVEVGFAKLGASAVNGADHSRVTDAVLIWSDADDRACKLLGGEG